MIFLYRDQCPWNIMWLLKQQPLSAALMKKNTCCSEAETSFFKHAHAVILYYHGITCVYILPTTNNQCTRCMLVKQQGGSSSLYRYCLLWGIYCRSFSHWPWSQHAENLVGPFLWIPTLLNRAGEVSISLLFPTIWIFFPILLSHLVFQ